MPFFLFPGQGSQTPGMGQDFYSESPDARAIFDRAQPLLPENFLDTLFRGTDEQLRDTRMAQLGLVLVGAAITAYLKGSGIEPDAAAGHSIGEIGALHAAGSLALEDALRLTRERARLMAEESPEGTMAAVLGMDAAAIAASLPGDVDIANYNSPGQIIISGPTSAVGSAIEKLKLTGAKRVMPLPVSGPFHSWCMKAAAEKFKNFVEEVPITAPRTRFVSSVSGREESDPSNIRELLWQQLYSPVRWIDTMQTIGPGNALELGPGNVLAGLAKRIDNAPTVRAAGRLIALAAT